MYIHYGTICIAALSIQWCNELQKERFFDSWLGQNLQYIWFDRYSYGTTNRIITNSKHAILKFWICICSEDFSFNIIIMNFLNFVIQLLSISLKIHQHSVGSYNMSLIQFITHMKSQKCRFVTKFKAAGRMCMLYYHV